ncbi:outer membrane lipoprotein-sorting protein [Fontimonas sp. SYSU GA230001]|uniref:outer membrane lipoprotein-sorting protein n=1 Tax=Fontimonas sp. SYSU GA230001 TaxID=3142450 RepID=UPI0032B52190
MLSNGKKRTIRPALWLALALALAGPPAGAAQTVESLHACMLANVPASLRIQTVELVATDVGGTVRTLRGRVYALRETQGDQSLVRATLRIESPEYLAGAAYLVRQGEGERVDGMYVYLPSVRRVRRISGDFADGALLGTNFSYYDFKQMQYAVSDATATVAGEEDVGGRRTAILDYVPAPTSGSKYTRVRSWVDQQTCVPIQTEFHQADGARKRITVPAAALRKADGRWYASEVEMVDLIDGSKTVLRVLGLDTQQVPPSRLFNPATFYLGN